MEANNDTNCVKQEVTLPPFEKIRKVTIRETYQYFMKLIEGKTIKNLEQCIDLSTELSVFDESLQFLLIDSLRLEKEALKILLGENENQIKRLLGCKWFFQNLPADFCTTQIFPYVSLSVRCKIINRLSRHLESTEEAEKYFAFIRTNYDNIRADYILPRCSPEFISAYVKETNATFSYNTGLRILWNISKRYPEIAIQVLSNIFEIKDDGSYCYPKYRKILQFLVGAHPDLMAPFLKKYMSVLPGNTFGRTLTKKVATKLQEDLFLNPVSQQFDKPPPDEWQFDQPIIKVVRNLVFKEKTLFSMLSFEGKVKYIIATVISYSENLTSRNWARSDHRLASLLKLVPLDRRQELIDRAFRKVYNVDFFEYPKTWSPEVLETLPADTRARYVKKLEEYSEEGIIVFDRNVGYNCFSWDNPELHLYLYDSRLAFEKFREILRKTPAVAKREAILTKLVQSCWINRDVKVLEEVVEYVAKRHRNDDHNVIFRFMETICEHFPASDLSTVIYEKLDELAYFCYLKGKKNDYVYNRWMERHICHRLENNLDVDSLVKRFFDNAVVKSYVNTFVQDFHSKHSRTLILLMCKETILWLRKKPTDEPDNLEMSTLISSCQQYNKFHRSEPILLNEIPGLEDIIKEKMRKTYGEVGWEEWPLDIWQRYYDEVTSSYHKPRILLYIFKQNPHLMETHLEGILKILFYEYFREYNAFFNFMIKSVSFLGKTDQMKEIILNEFKNGDSLDKRKTALLLYSYMCTTDEFCKVVDSYLPKQEMIEPGSREDFDAIQMHVPRLIKNVKPRCKNFQLLLKFFFGDFLKSVLSSFYKCCYNTRCDVVIPFLKNHLKELPPKVSYLKDTIRLILELSDRKGRTDFCLECWEKYKHYSVRSSVLHFISELFLEEHTEEYFKVFQKCILDCDEQTIAALPELHRIPKKFLSDYVNTLWRFSESQKPTFRGNFRRNLLQGFTEANVNSLSTEFCESIIKTYLFDASSEIPVAEFAVVYLTADPAAVGSRTFMVLNLIKDRKPSARSVYGFFNLLTAYSTKKPAHFADLFTIILDNWPEYPVGVLYEERVLFIYHNLYQKVVKRLGESDTVPVEFGKELNKFFTSVVNLNDLLPIYVEALKTFFSNYGTERVILTVKELVSGSRNRSIAALAVLSLPSEAIVWYNKEGAKARNVVNSKKELNEFVKILEGYGDSVVDIYLRSKLGFAK